MKSFTLPGPIHGYVRTTQRQKWVDPRYAEYHAWKKLVRLAANKAGIPHVLHPEAEHEINVLVLWKGKARLDTDNILKGVMDSLFRNDRRVLRVTARSVEYCEKESLTVNFS